MPASLARFSKFQEQRRLSLLLRASEAAMALTEIITPLPPTMLPLDGPANVPSGGDQTVNLD
jgi:hypothetical protein